MKKIYYSNIEDGEKSFREIILMVEFFFYENIFTFYFCICENNLDCIYLLFNGEENLLFVEYICSWILIKRIN